MPPATIRTKYTTNSLLIHDRSHIAQYFTFIESANTRKEVAFPPRVWYHPRAMCPSPVPEGYVRGPVFLTEALITACTTKLRAARSGIWPAATARDRRVDGQRGRLGRRLRLRGGVPGPGGRAGSARSRARSGSGTIVASCRPSSKARLCFCPAATRCAGPLASAAHRWRPRSGGPTRAARPWARWRISRFPWKPHVGVSGG